MKNWKTRIKILIYLIYFGERLGNIKKELLLKYIKIFFNALLSLIILMFYKEYFDF